MSTQQDLIPTILPIPGLEYRGEFIDPGEEDALLAGIRNLPFAPARYLQYTALRRIVSFGGQYNFSTRELLPAAAIPEFLMPLRRRLAGWADLKPDRLSHAMVAEYQVGTPLGWHRDVPDFEVITGVSLGGRCRMRFRPYPPEKPSPRTSLKLELARRSAYILRDEARWNWQHAISPTKEMRYSVTFRSLRR
jgi:alkylated DNA repair dioxygenase AlkB